MKLILIILVIFLTTQYLDYQVKTEDKSIQGFIEHLKKKYYYKKKD